VIAMVKTLTLKITEEEHKKIKVLSAEEGKSIKDFVMDLIRTYSRGKKDEELIIEPVNEDELTEEEREAIEEGRRDMKTGNYQEMEEAFKDGYF
jgi:hypothetical protein